MPSPIDSGAGEKQAGDLGLPGGLKIGSVYPFGGLNVCDSRIGIESHEFSWLENYIRIGKGKMRTAWDVGTALYVAPPDKQIVSFFWFNIGPLSNCAVFLNDGTAVQVAYPGGAVTTMGDTAGQFYQAGGGLPACCPWGSQYLLISNNLTINDYWVWDGSLLYGAGEISPVITLTSGGSGYTSAPTVVAFGGEGTGATFTATIANSSVVSVVPNSPGSGYGPADIVQLQFSGGGIPDSGAILQANIAGGTISNLLLLAGGSGFSSVPTVTFTGGGGTGAAATATLAPGGLASIVVGGGGAGYTTAPNVLITGGGGGGATAVATVTAGAVTQITLTNAGTGYTSNPTVSFTGGGGTGATATANLIGAKIGTLTLTSPGSGYTGSPTVGFTGGGGSGALATVELGAGVVTSVTVVDGGANYPSTPTLTFSGGGGSGAEATANLTAGVISSVDVTNGGTGYTSAPAVTVQTGINNAASGTVALMPVGISGSSIETFLSRAWLGHPNQAGTLPTGGVINITAPGSFVDFATSDGGLLYTNTDRFLRAQYTTLRQSNGYLYTLGDSSVGVVNNVQTSGSPPTTTFNSLNVDPQTGTSWRDTCQDYSRTILFANPFGAWGIYGGAVTKISKKLDPLFDAAVVPPAAGALTPSAAVSVQFSQRLYCLLLTITDPFIKQPRNVMLAWDEVDWTVLSQSASLIYIGTQETDSDPVAWGTDGKALFPLFTSPSATLAKTLQTKYFAGETAFVMEQSYAIYVTAQNMQPGETTLTFSSTTVDGIGQAEPLNLPGWQGDEVPEQGGSFETENRIAFPCGTSVPATFGTSTDPPVAGSGIGLTMITHAPDYELHNLQLGYIDVQGIA